MKVGEDELYSLLHLTQNKPTRKTTKSDHITLIMDPNLHFSKTRPDPKELFNFKSETCQEKFKHITDNETQLADCLNNDLPVHEIDKIWQKKSLECVS